MNSWKDDDTFLAKWLASGLSKEELREFESSKEFNEFEQIARLTEGFEVPEFNIDAGFADLKSRRRNSASKAPKKAVVHTLNKVKIWTVAAAVLIVGLVGVYFYQTNQTGLIEYQTAFAEQKNIQLPDGSEIILNANSSLSYHTENWENNRRLTLNGEAFFDVKTGSTFSVNTDFGSVTVLGTRFNVKSRNGFFDASVYEGRIRVEIDTISRELDPGEEIRYEPGKPVQKLNFEISESPSWTSGIISLNNVPLNLAIQELQSQFGIRVSGAAIPDSLIYTGNFSIRDAGNAVMLVLDPFGIEYSYNEHTKELTVFN